MVDQTKQSDPLALYPESIVDRQQTLQELSERLKAQLLELKKEYGLEPSKGNLILPLLRSPDILC